MANRLEEFYKIKAGKIREEKDIDNVILSFSDFRRITGVDVIVKEILRTLLIAKGTYVFDPEFGSGIHFYLFEPADSKTLVSIDIEIDKMIKNLDFDTANITFVSAFFRNKKGFRITFKIEYFGEERKVTVDVDESILDSQGI